MIGMSQTPPGGGGNLIQAFTGIRASSDQLDDTEFESGTIVNSGAGWNTYKFREAFEEVPVLLAVPQEFSGWIEIKGISATGFMYCLRKPKLTATTTSGYFANGASADSTHSSKTYVSGANLDSETTADKVKINYLAVDYGGDR